MRMRWVRAGFPEIARRMREDPGHVVPGVKSTWTVPEYILPDAAAAEWYEFENGSVVGFFSAFDPNTRVAETPIFWLGSPL